MASFLVAKKTCIDAPIILISTRFFLHPLKLSVENLFLNSKIQFSIGYSKLPLHGPLFDASYRHLHYLHNSYAGIALLRV